MHKLYTDAGERLGGIPWNVYPRPQCKRDSFVCLNGEWEFAVTETDTPPAEYDRRIAQAVRLLEGYSRQLLRELTDEMAAEAEAL